MTDTPPVDAQPVEPLTEEERAQIRYEDQPGPLHDLLWAIGGLAGNPYYLPQEKVHALLEKARTLDAARAGAMDAEVIEWLREAIGMSDEWASIARSLVTSKRREAMAGDDDPSYDPPVDAQPVEPLTAAQIVAPHYPVPGSPEFCHRDGQRWPCDVIRLDAARAGDGLLREALEMTLGALRNRERAAGKVIASDVAVFAFAVLDGAPNIDALRAALHATATATEKPS